MGVCLGKEIVKFLCIGEGDKKGKATFITKGECVKCMTCVESFQDSHYIRGTDGGM